MKVAKQIFLALGLAVSAALAINNTGLADCGGLFLLHMSDKQFSAKACSVRDSLTVNNFDIYGAFHHISIQGRYTENWHLKGLSELNIASAGFESHFKYFSLGINVNTLPFVSSVLSIHREDSLFRASASIARGSADMGNIRWLSKKETDIIHMISVDWETHALYRALSAESKIGDHYINLSLSHIKTLPRNPDKEYYIRDSASAIVINANYGHAFDKSRLHTGYTFADADVTLYGIYHSEDSRKRFMYLPIEATFHHLYTRWEQEKLHAHLDYAHLSGKLFSNPNRFYETLAPNRALPASVIKGISFAFLQKTFRVDADFNAFAVLGGASYRWQLGNRYIFTPIVALDFFGASGKTRFDKDIETTIITTHQHSNEKIQRKLKSIGSILSLEGELRKDGPINVALVYGISQIIPFYIDYRDYNANENKNETSSEKSPGQSGRPGKDSGTSEIKSEDKSGTLEKDVSKLLFRNGFATHLGISVRF